MPTQRTRLAKMQPSARAYHAATIVCRPLRSRFVIAGPLATIRSVTTSIALIAGFCIGMATDIFLVYRINRARRAAVSPSAKVP